ncbi:nitroreductase/quinone reductase family protein [Streptomyces sp. NPDC098781]|uniref:nitroreductase/quinone reductase family protein n=1 Tax=Streptomyces sp. NPDC098781 TaxID=3366097 RepID=UPI00381C322A
MWARVLRTAPGQRCVALLSQPKGRRLDRFLVRLTGRSLLIALFTAMQGVPRLPVLLIHTTGRKSGQRRTTVMPYFRVGTGLYVIASAAGQKNDPLWVRNLRGEPAAQITLRRRTYAVRSRELADGSPERDAVWAHATATSPAYTQYQRTTERLIPVIALDQAPVYATEPTQ